MFKDSYNLILKHQKGKLVLLSFLLALTVGMNAIASALLMEIIDTILPMASVYQLIAAIVIYVAISLLQTITSYLCSTYNARFTLQVAVDLKKRIIEKIYKRPGAYFTKNTMGDLYQSVESDTTMFCEFVINNLFSLLNILFNLVISIVFLLVLDWKLLLIILALQPISFIFQGVMSPKISKISEEQRTLSGEYTSLSQAVVSNPIDLIISGHRKKIVDTMFGKMDQLNQTAKKFIGIEMFSIHMENSLQHLTILL